MMLYRHQCRARPFVQALRREISFYPIHITETIPFFTPPFGSSAMNGGIDSGVRLDKGKGKEKERGPPRWKGEEEVDAREWDIRVGEYSSTKDLSPCHVASSQDCLLISVMYSSRDATSSRHLAPLLSP